MFGWLKKTGNVIRSALTTGGNVLRRFGEVGGKVLRTVNSYQPVVSGMVSEIGQHVGRPDIADKVNKGINYAGRSAPYLDNVSRLGHAMTLM